MTKSVVTNGCFEILHAGHTSFLESARCLGDRLVVCLNSDESVRRLKGPGRPLQPWYQRAYSLLALKAVDEVRPLDSDNMVAVLSSGMFKFWVKGGDYTVETLNQDEVAAARQANTQIIIIPVLFNVHTSTLLQRL